MRALLKPTVIVFAALMLPQAGFAENDPARLAAVAEAAVSCALTADKNGANASRFKSEGGWIPDEAGKEIRHNKFPIVVTLPPDPDGVSRNCEVRATMASQSDQKEMLLALEVLLRPKPIEQTDSIIWMFGKPPTVRGLQFYPDKKSKQPQIRFVGAAF
jgi:hypothetical protein